MIPYMVGELAPIQLISLGSWSNKSPGGTIFGPRRESLPRRDLEVEVP